MIDLGHYQRRADFFDLVSSLEFAFGETMPFLDLHLDLQSAELAGKTMGKAAGDQHPLDPPLLQNLADHRGEAL